MLAKRSMRFDCIIPLTNRFKYIFQDILKKIIKIKYNVKVIVKKKREKIHLIKEFIFPKHISVK